MQSQLRSTLAGLLVALTFAATTALIGTPMSAADTAQNAVAEVGAAQPDQTSATSTADRIRRTVRVNLAMPYYSFGRLLPPRES